MEILEAMEEDNSKGVVDLITTVMIIAVAAVVTEEGIVVDTLHRIIHMTTDHNKKDHGITQ